MSNRTIRTFLYLLSQSGRFLVTISAEFDFVFIDEVLHPSELTPSRAKWYDALAVFFFNIETGTEVFQKKRLVISINKTRILERNSQPQFVPQSFQIFTKLLIVSNSLPKELVPIDGCFSKNQ